MGVPCKLQSSKLGKGTQQTSVLLKRHSIIAHGAIAKRGSANTPKTWKLLRPHNVWRGNHAPTFARRASVGDALRAGGTISATSHAQRISGEIRSKRQRAGDEGVRRAGWTDWFVVGLGPHVLR